jgi:hypothetical protein
LATAQFSTVHASIRSIANVLTWQEKFIELIKIGGALYLPFDQGYGRFTEKSSFEYATFFFHLVARVIGNNDRFCIRTLAGIFIKLISGMYTALH